MHKRTASSWLGRHGACSLLVVTVGCAEPDPVPTDASLGADASGSDAGGFVVDCSGLVFTPPDVACEPLASDYAPGAEDEWPACVSDDGEYHRIEPTISTIGRVMAFERIADLLFDVSIDPSGQAFLDARLIYQEDEGLDSRVVRRYDPHFVVPEGTDCATDGVPEAYPNYCVGPAVLQPILLESFNAGITGEGEPSRVHAARIEAGLLWFLYVSPYKESLTCTDVAKDCDSAYAYYTGGEMARGGIGLARYVEEVDPEAHDRAWDGLLAVRCWRDLDSAVPATDEVRRELARTQYDRAILHGVAAIVRDRITTMCERTDGLEAEADWASVQILGRALVRAIDAEDSDAAATVAALLGNDTPTASEIAVILEALDQTFVCP